MSASTKLVKGWSVTLDGEVPTILDEELGAKLGFARPRKIRELIERMISEGILNDSDVRPTVGRRLHGVVMKDTVNYHLTELAALMVIGRCDTRIAHAITRQVYEVFLAVRHELQSRPQEVPVLATSPIVAGNKALRKELADRCHDAARTLDVRLAKIHGAVRKQFGVPGVYRTPVLLHSLALNFVRSLNRGDLLLPPIEARPAQGADPRQSTFSFHNGGFQ